MEARTLKATSQEKPNNALCGVVSQGLPNATRKKNDEKPKRQLKQA